MMINSIADIRKYLTSDKAINDFEILEGLLSGGELEKFIFEVFDSYSKNKENSVNIYLFIKELKNLINEFIDNISNEYIENYLINNNYDNRDEINNNVSYALSNYKRIADCNNYELVKIIQMLIVNNPNYEFIIDSSFDYLIKDFISDKRFFLLNYEKILNEFMDNKLGLIINPKGFSVIDQYSYGKAYRCGDWICIFLKVINDTNLVEV